LAEGAINHMAGRPDPFAELEIPDDWLQGAPRSGPLFPASHWPRSRAFFAASTAVSAALRARRLRGGARELNLSPARSARLRGRCMARAEKIDAPMFNSWILGARSPKGHFQCADGRWIHNWYRTRASF